MANIFDGFLKQIATGDSVKDYNHASKLFVDNSYGLSPKYDWLYHVFFDVDKVIASNINVDQLTEVGMLVKSVDLPKYSVDTKTLNSYNRHDIVQTKINYNAITIVFHDDQADTVRNFWYDYYRQYYKDSDLGYIGRSGLVNPNYHSDYKYQENPVLKDFGYSIRSSNGVSGGRYLQSIRVYSLHQKRFSEYTLINPIITAFNHGNHNAGANGILENSMTIQFTSVLYAGGFVSPNTVKGFGDLHYDKAPSPLTPAGGGTNSILGPGGIVSAIDAISSGIESGNSKGLGASLFTAVRALGKNKDADLNGLAQSELLTAAKDVLSGRDPSSRFFVPTSGALANSGKSIANIFNLPRKNTTDTASAGSITSNNTDVSFIDPSVESLKSLVEGFGTASSGVDLVGALTDAAGNITGGPLNKNILLDKNLQARAVDTSAQAGFSGLLASIRTTAREQATFLADRSTRTGSDPIETQGFLQFPSPTFTSGTNTVLGNAPSELSKSPIGAELIQAIGPDGFNDLDALATQTAANAQKFVESGNAQKLVDDLTSRLPGFSTNPGTAT
tara:strand:- start:555 stop:2234 length:1680 start_codon:yes stop_codon:yes gene_type:complete